MNLIPHTLAVTTLGALEAGARVNLEVDLVARYVARLHEALITARNSAGLRGARTQSADEI